MFDDVSVSKQHARLRSAEKLVTAHGDEVRAGVDGLLHEGFIGGDSSFINVTGAAANVEQHGDMMFAAEGDHLLDAWVFSEADDAVIARMDFE